MSVEREQPTHGFPDTDMSSFVANKLASMAQMEQNKGDAKGR
jgi:hypothetical protein